MKLFRDGFAVDELSGHEESRAESRRSRASAHSPHGLDLLDLDYRVVPIRQHRLCSDDLNLFALEWVERNVRAVQVSDEVSIGNALQPQGVRARPLDEHAGGRINSAFARNWNA